MEITFDYLYPSKAALMACRYNLFRDNEHKLSTVIVKDGLIVPSPFEEINDCCVVAFCGGGEIVEESCWEPDPRFVEFVHRHTAEMGVSAETDKIGDGTILFGGYFNTHWGHFLTDVVSRLWPLYSDSTLKYDYIIFCVHDAQHVDIPKNVRQVLLLLGIMDRIIFTSCPVAGVTIVVPEYGVYPRARFSKDTKGIYDKIVEKALSFKPKEKFSSKLFMSRSLLKKAIENEAGLKYIDRWMKANGYEIIYPERMDVISLVHALQGAEEVVAISGTLPHNLLLGRDGTVTTIIEKYPTINNYQQGIDLLRNLSVTMIDCGAFIRPVSPGLGPFIIYPTLNLVRFAKDRGLTTPPEFSRKDIRRSLRLFFKRFRRHYGERWVVSDWLRDELNLCCEAYEETDRIFSPWLSGLRPVTFLDLINPRRILKYVWKKYIAK